MIRRIANHQLLLLGLLSSLLFLSARAEAVSLAQAKAYAKKKCDFAVSFEMTSDVSPMMKSLFKGIGDKPGDPFNADFLCIFEGAVGAGVNKVSGCVIGVLNIERDTDDLLLNQKNFSPRLSITQDKKCTAEVALDLLFSKKVKNSNNYIPHSDGSLVSIYIYGKRSTIQIYKKLPLMVVNDDLGIAQTFLKKTKEFEDK